MKITVITSPFLELPPIAIGAVEKLFYLLAGEWVDMGHHVAFVCCGGGDDERMEFIRLKKYRRTGSTKKDLVWDFFYSVKALWKCPKTDILLCNTFWTPALAPLFRWKYRRLAYGVHRYPKGQFWLYPFVHAFICVSTAVADELRRQAGRNGKPKRIFTVVNPIDGEVFNDQSVRVVVRGRVLYAGRIHPDKGLVCLSRACHTLFCKGICSELVLIGSYATAKGGGGEAFLAYLKHVADGCPIVFDGEISDAGELATRERAAALFVYPTRDVHGEACPIAPMEAMALGVPTVVSDMRCFDDYVNPNDNAEVFPVGNVEALTEKMEGLLVNQELANRLSRAAVTTLRSYTHGRVAKKYLDLFEGLLS